MAQVLPAERDLRRVIGDGESVPDGEVEGLTDHDLVELYRGLVLLRTYDERSVVYHSQGRIGTYAIYWNHEAMQAGSVYALADDDWIFPSYRESAIGLLRGLPVSTVLSWWRGHPAGWWNPADYNVASICVPIGTHVPHAAGLAWGKRLRGENACAIAYFGDGATSEGAFHEGANFAAVMRAPLVLFCNNNGWAISTPVEAQTRAETLADKAVGYGMPAVARGRARHPRRVRGDARSRCACPCGRGADVHRGGQLPGCAARDGGRPEGVHRPRAGRGGEEARVRRALRGLPAARRDPHGRDGRVDPGRGRAGDARRDRGGRGGGSPRTRASSSSTRYVDPPASFEPTSRS